MAAEALHGPHGSGHRLLRVGDVVLAEDGTLAFAEKGSARSERFGSLHALRWRVHLLVPPLEASGTLAVV